MCRELIEDGSFEGDIKNWTKLGDGITVRKRDQFLAPPDGEWAARLWPDPSESGFLLYKAFATLDPAKVESATLSYQIDGHTLERLDSKDSILVGIWSANLNICQGSACTDTYEYVRNQDIERGWQERSFDITKSVTKAAWTGGWQLIFGASNDVSDSTWWHIDMVSIQLCASP